MLVTEAQSVSASPLGVSRFLSRRVLILGSLFLIAFFYLIWFAYLLQVATDSLTGPVQPRIDFLAYWVGSSFALDGHAAAAYIPERLHELQVTLHGRPDGSFAWLYPPVFFFYVLPLSLVPVIPALGLWFSGTFALALSAVRRISSDRAVLILAVAFPATFWNLVIGQNGLLTAGLFAWGILLLRDRPTLAGALFGLIVYKPQFFPLIPIALLAGGHRCAAVASVATAGVICLASLGVFGIDAWEGFITAASDRSDLIMAGGAESGKMQSVTGALLLAGVSSTVIQLIQPVVALLSAGFVVWLWRKDVATEYKAAGLALAMLLAAPYSYHYDLTLLGLATLWLAVRFFRDGWRAGDAELMLVAWLTPLVALAAGQFLAIPVTPIVILALVAVLLRRVQSPSVARQPVAQSTAVAI